MTRSEFSLFSLRIKNRSRAPAANRMTKRQNYKTNSAFSHALRRLATLCTRKESFFGRQSGYRRVVFAIFRAFQIVGPAIFPIGHSQPEAIQILLPKEGYGCLISETSKPPCARRYGIAPKQFPLRSEAFSKCYAGAPAPTLTKVLSMV